jgi:hypothetical protein
VKTHVDRRSEREREREREREKMMPQFLLFWMRTHVLELLGSGVCVCVCFFLLVDGIDVRFVACLFLFWETMRMPEVFLFRHDNAVYWMRPWIDPFRFSL